VRIALVQLAAAWGQPVEGWERAATLLRRAAPFDLALLPETALTGYVSPQGLFDPSAFAEPLDGPTITRAAELSRELSSELIVPLVEARDGALFNSVVRVDAMGSIAGIYRKRHPWYPERWATPGTDDHPVWEIGGRRVVPAICFDVHFLAGEAASQLKLADLLVFSSAWVDSGPDDSRGPILTRLAQRFDVSIANANWGAGSPHVPGQGGSRLVHRTGETIARLGVTEEVLVHDLDLG